MAYHASNAAITKTTEIAVFFPANLTSVLAPPGHTAERTASSAPSHSCHHYRIADRIDLLPAYARGMGDDTHQKARALLEQTHEFPTNYRIRVIVHNLPTITTRIVATLEASGTPLTEPLSTPRSSREGTYLSLGLTFDARDADHVLEVYQLVRGVDNVIMCL